MKLELYNSSHSFVKELLEIKDYEIKGVYSIRLKTRQIIARHVFYIDLP